MNSSKNRYDSMQRLLEATSCHNSKQLADFLGVVPQSVYDARKKGRVPDAWIRTIAERTGTSADWLFFGERSSEERRIPSIDDGCEIVAIPMVEARLSAGGGSLETGSKAVGSFAFRQSFLSAHGCAKNMVLMQVSGDSMEPELVNGDTVLIDQSKKQIYPNAMYAVRVGDAIYVKRIDTTLTGGFILKSSNPSYQPIQIERGEQDDEFFAVIGRIIWSCRNVG